MAYELHLDRLLRAHQAELAALADAWLEAGADGFIVASDNRPLMAWPIGFSQNGAPSIKAPIEQRGLLLGELRVSGVTGTLQAARLAADARMLASLINLEADLDQMAAELVEAHDQLLALYDLSRSGRRTLALQETLATLTREAARLLHASGAFLGISDEGGERIIVQYPERSLSLELLAALLARARTAPGEIRLEREECTAQGLRGLDNLVLIPIEVKGVHNAGLGLYHASGGGVFDSPALKLARSVAEQSGMQIENALFHQEALANARIEAEMALARRVQMHLLPQQAPRVPGLDIYAITNPALQVGGDFYDFIPPFEDNFLFSVGDVSGKGLSAALLMAITRTALRSFAHSRPDARALDILASVNADLYNDFTEVGMFATAFLGQYIPETGVLTYVNAGHSPVIYCPRGSEARLLRADGTALGILSVSLCSAQTLQMNPGDVLIVATDGFSEARNAAGELVGYDRLCRITESLAHRSARGITDGWLTAIQEHVQGHPQGDDLTLLVLKGDEGS